MKFVALAILATLAVASARIAPLGDEQYELLFSAWTKQHGKSYESAEFLHRFMVWKQNLDFIRHHNARTIKSHTVAMNAFGDLTNEEFLAKYTGYVPRDNSFLRSNNRANLSNENLPASIDWEALGKVTPIKDQGQCGSCWAFSSTGSIEGAYAIAKNSLVSLSEQQLVDCSTAEGNQGCNGGLMDQAFQYVISNGLCTEQSYPYTAEDGTCTSSKCKCTVKVAGFTDVDQTEDALAAAVAQQPVSVAVDASGSSWQFYSSGVMSNCVYQQLDHGVLSVGYGATAAGEKYWKVKNSWGTGWGDKGYVLLARGVGGVGECGITQAASYPTGATSC